MGHMAMGKCEGKQRKYFHTQKNYKHFQGGMEDYNLAMFTHVMDFFREHASF
jgi:hypothetical protein